VSPSNDAKGTRLNVSAWSAPLAVTDANGKQSKHTYYLRMWGHALSDAVVIHTVDLRPATLLDKLGIFLHRGGLAKGPGAFDGLERAIQTVTERAEHDL
jgi:hypothetical protein